MLQTADRQPEALRHLRQRKGQVGARQQQQQDSGSHSRREKLCQKIGHPGPFLVYLSLTFITI
jgi:hypothetical protein